MAAVARQQVAEEVFQSDGSLVAVAVGVGKSVAKSNCDSCSQDGDVLGC